MLIHLERSRGVRLRDLGMGLGLTRPPVRPPKQFGYQIVSRLIDAGPAAISVLDLETRGISLRTVRVPPQGRPYESTSFAAFEPFELIREVWESSTLRRQIGYILFIPLEGQSKTTTLPSCVLGRAFFHRLSESDLAMVRDDWELCRERIANGEAGHPLRERESKVVHVRPHARNALDTVAAPGGGRVPKMSFWLNHAFVGDLVARKRSKA